MVSIKIFKYVGSSENHSGHVSNMDIRYRYDEFEEIDDMLISDLLPIVKSARNQ